MALQPGVSVLWEQQVPGLMNLVKDTYSSKGSIYLHHGNINNVWIFIRSKEHLIYCSAKLAKVLLYLKKSTK